MIEPSYSYCMRQLTSPFLTSDILTQAFAKYNVVCYSCPIRTDRSVYQANPYDAFLGCVSKFPDLLKHRHRWILPCRNLVHLGRSAITNGYPTLYRTIKPLFPRTGT